MSRSRRRFLTSIGGSLVAAPALSAQTTPPLPSIELGEPLEFLAIQNVTVIDMTGRPPIENATVFLDGSRIAGVGPPARTAVAAEAPVIDGTGKFLIPGLWDMHAHPQVRGLPLFTANGITGLRWMNSPTNSTVVRSEIETARRVGPQLVVGLELNGPAKGQTGDIWWIVSTPEKARAAVRRGRRDGYDFIKVYNLLPREAYFAIMEEARSQALPVMGHVPHAVAPAECSNAGQSSIEHTWGVWMICIDRYEEYRKLAAADPAGTGGFSTIQPDVASFHVSRALDLAQTMRKNNTWLCPTLIASQLIALGRDLGGSDDPRLRFISPALRARWDHPEFPSTPSNQSAHIQYLETVLTLHKAGVGILAGTDVATNLPFAFPGFSLHEELQQLVGAGLKPFEALRAATSGPAEFLGKTDLLGTVEPGKRAELVLLDADPLADITNTRRINAVFTQGRLYRRSALDKMLEFAEEDARN